MRQGGLDKEADQKPNIPYQNFAIPESLQASPRKDGQQPTPKVQNDYLMQINSPATPLSMSGQSLGSLQVNFDQNLNKFYALAQNNGLALENQSSSQGPGGVKTSAQAQLEALEEGKSSQLERKASEVAAADPADANPYAHIESLLAAQESRDIRHQTVKVPKDANLMDVSAE